MHGIPDLGPRCPPCIGVHMYAEPAPPWRAPQERDDKQCETRAEAILSFFACADEAIGTRVAQTGLGARMVAV